jgi:hypothetical protein
MRLKLLVCVARTGANMPQMAKATDDGLTGTYSRPEVLVLYLKRPREESWELRRCGGALEIQRLEGSRPLGDYGICIWMGRS